MLARNVTVKQLEQAAKRVNLGLIEVRPNGTGIRFRLEPTGERYSPGNSKKYQLVRDSMGGRGMGVRKDGKRNVHATCWHGHREFFRELFRLVPEAKVQTAQTIRTLRERGRYYTAENFENVFRGTDRNIGSMMYPLQYSDACDCSERGLN